MRMKLHKKKVLISLEYSTDDKKDNSLPKEKLTKKKPEVEG